jgi:hypothetical protein
MPWGKAVDLASPIRLAEACLENYQARILTGAQALQTKTFQFGTAWQPPARPQLRVSQ